MLPVFSCEAQHELGYMFAFSADAPILGQPSLLNMPWCSHCGIWTSCAQVGRKQKRY